MIFGLTAPLRQNCPLQGGGCSCVVHVMSNSLLNAALFIQCNFASLARFLLLLFCLFVTLQIRGHESRREVARWKGELLCSHSFFLQTPLPYLILQSNAPGFPTLESMEGQLTPRQRKMVDSLAK